MIGIYRITHLPTGRHYVGQSQDIQRRWVHHKKRSKSHISLALKKYGEDAFEFVVICECTVEELDRFEEFWIAKLEAFVKGFNLSAGGNQAKRGPQTREKMRAAAQAKWDSRTPEERAVWAAKHNAAARSETRKAASSAVARKNWANPSIRARMSESRCGERGPNKKLQRKDRFVFEHIDGRKIEATLWEIAHLHGAVTRQAANEMVQGRRQISKGWRIFSKLTDSAIAA